MYKLEPLNYSYCDLEPYIDTHTLGLHHNKHQKNYLNRLNELLIKNNYNFQYSLSELVKYVGSFNREDQEDIMFNLGGVINHNIYFKSISDLKVEPKGMFLRMIINEFGSYEKFKQEFKKNALSIKGSGYTYLVLDKGHLQIVNLANQDNPYTYNYIPLICIDVWEHAYYINYENKRDLYIDNFFEIVDFSIPNKTFDSVV